MTDVKNIFIIIPSYNENEYLPVLLKKLHEMNDAECLKEIIVCDGKSTDNTISVANEFKISVVMNSQPGRARQMNSGAKMATGKIQSPTGVRDARCARQLDDWRKRFRGASRLSSEGRGHGWSR